MIKKEDFILRTYKKARWLYEKNIPFIPRIITELMRVIYSCEIPWTSQINDNVAFPHKGLGVVIHPEAIIEKNTTILQNVTIGGKTGKAGAPKIGENCIIGAGSSILGDIKIGNNCIIGANSVVVNDIPNNCVVVGAPGRIIKKNINRRDYDWDSNKQ